MSPDWQPEDWAAWFEERAAIREFDGGQRRPDAEADAETDLIERWAYVKGVDTIDAARAIGKVLREHL